MQNLRFVSSAVPKILGGFQNLKTVKCRSRHVRGSQNLNLTSCLVPIQSYHSLLF